MAAKGREQQWHRSPSLWLCSEDLSSYSLRETFGSETPSGTFGVLLAPLIWLSQQLEHRVDDAHLHIPPSPRGQNHLVLSLKPATLCTEKSPGHTATILQMSPPLGPHILGELVVPAAPTPLGP